jgi:DNA primase
LRISPQSIEEVRERADIVEVASEFTALRRQGNSFTGLCPFHQENTPSFSVSPEKGLYYCFGCGAGGDAIKMISQLKNFSFAETISFLADKFGIELEYEEQTAGEVRDLERRRRAYRALAAAAAYYHKCLKEARVAEPARAYLRERGFSRETIEEFRLGYAPPGGFVRVARRLGMEREVLEDAGLLSSRGRDRFYERITFPISDYRGRVMGFGARAMGEAKPKYLNSPETRIFNKRNLLYGFPQVAEPIRRTGAALVVEGYTDVLMLYQCGIRNAVATLGTAITENHLRRLSSYAENIYLLFDPDEAGEKAIQRAAAEAAKMKLDLRVLRLEEDPADWLLRHPAEEFRELLGRASPVLEYSIRRIVESTRGSGALDRARARPEIEAMIRGIEDPILRREAVRLASEALSVDPSFFGNLMRPGGSGGRSRHAGEAREFNPARQAEREVLALILTAPEQTAGALRDGVEVEGLAEPVKLGPEDFTEPDHARLFGLLEERPGTEIGSVLADERARPHLDLVGALTLRGDRIEPSQPAIRAAWLRLRVLAQERAKRSTGDLEEKQQLHKEILQLKAAISAEVSTP